MRLKCCYDKEDFNEQRPEEHVQSQKPQHSYAAYDPLPMRFVRIGAFRKERSG
jgi:hypothetical protein